MEQSNVNTYSYVPNCRGGGSIVRGVGKKSKLIKRGVGINGKGWKNFRKKSKNSQKMHENERIRGHFRKIVVLDSSKISKSQTGGVIINGNGW